MIYKNKTKEVIEYGDFQTPLDLAFAATRILCKLGVEPCSILEPTCGRGAFIEAAVRCFPKVELIFGVDINKDHLEAAKIINKNNNLLIKLEQENFFEMDWLNVLKEIKPPFLILGNPPWVTNANLGSMGGKNLPKKSNFQSRQGIEALTGKSNFDISEWMLLYYLEWLKNRNGTIAVLCKTSIARKILLHIWKKNIPLNLAYIYKINTLIHFGAVVDACFFVLQLHENGNKFTCDVFDSLESETPSYTIGYLDGYIISNVSTYNYHRELLGVENHYIWRSGIKHDCSKIMELKITPNGYKNGFGDSINIEDTILFPMLKSSDIGNGRVDPRYDMLVTQKFVGENTNYIKIKAPKTWGYLFHHSPALNNRKSIIYKNKPSFSIFGVGPYTFSPWKIAISGFYKKLKFTVIGPINDKPVVFDDTVYFLSFWTKEEAYFIESLLSSKVAENFFRSMIYWDEKRPITVDLLKRLNLFKLAERLGRKEEYTFFTIHRESPSLMKAGC